jgi:hypothetical protein
MGMNKVSLKIWALFILALALLAGCIEGEQNASSVAKQEIRKTQEVVARQAALLSTPDDITTSLERFNLVRRAYWVNGMRQRAMALPNPIPDMPIGYVVLFNRGGAVVSQFVVEGKITSLNSYLTPDYKVEWGANGATAQIPLPDIDGAYGANDSGIFFFTADGKYIETTLDYIYSDIPFAVDNPVVRYSVEPK